MAESVTFTVDGNATSGTFDVESGQIAAVALSVTSGAAPPSDGTPDSLPNTGTGGLAGSGSSLPILPLALMAAVVLALGGVAVTRRSLR